MSTLCMCVFTKYFFSTFSKRKRFGTYVVICLKMEEMDDIRHKQNLQWKWQWFKEFIFLKYTRTKKFPHSVCKTRLCALCCVWDQMGSNLRSCDWSLFKMNRPHLAYDFPLESKWENKHIIISFRLQKNQGCCLSSNTYEVAMHNRIHDLVIDLAVQCTCPGPAHHV